MEVYPGHHCHVILNHFPSPHTKKEGESFRKEGWGWGGRILDWFLLILRQKQDGFGDSHMGSWLV